MPMVSNSLKLSICAVSVVVIGALEQQPLWAFSNHPLLDNSPQDPGIPNSAENDLLLRAARNMEIMNSKPEVADEEIESTNHYYTPRFIPEHSSTVSTGRLSPHIPPYSNRWVNLSSASPRPRKVPEPSAVLGIIAIASWIGVQQKIKKG